MKKLILSIALLFVLILSSCQQDTPYVVDCDQFPTHADCLDEQPTCDTGFILEDGTCVPQELECEEDQMEYDGECVDIPLICDDGFVAIGEECVFSNDSLGDYLDIYYLNDLHGTLEPSSRALGISYIANLVQTRKEQSPNNVLFLAGGDMLQGSALSNYFEGLSTITLLDAAGLDAFTIGNHEFDWGLETILQYRDGDPLNGEASFPFLGANIFQKSDDSMPEGIDPYTIIELGTHKIGIIGTMGYGLESSIAESRIAPYYFDDPIDRIIEHTEYLRDIEGCDTIIVVAHDPGSNLNAELGSLTGNQKVDAVFNGHSHQRFASGITGIPIVQSGGYGEYVGHIRLFFTDGVVTSFEANNYDQFDDPLLRQKDPEVEAILDAYIQETEALFNDPIIDSASSYSSYDLSAWIAKLMRVATDSDIAFQNYGGTRRGIDQDETITLSTLYEIWPFDNVIKTVELDGAVITNLLANLAYDTEIQSFEAGTMYRVATNDYVFDKTTNPFLDGDNPENTGILMRDLAELELTLQSDVFTEFYTSNAIQVSYPPNFDLALIKEEDIFLFLIANI